MEGEEQWYYVNAQGEPVGPYLERDIDALLRAGEISLSTPTWKQDQESWTPLGRFPAFAESLADDETMLALNSQPKESLTIPQPQTAVEDQVNLTQEKREQKVVKWKRQKARKKSKWYNPKVNTNIYITGLPQSVSSERVAEFFKKAGAIRLDKFTGEPKIKIYRDEAGNPKGDGLVSFLNEESVLLAITWLDQREIEPGAIVTVQPAQFEQKGNYRPRASVKIDKVQLIKAKHKQTQQLDWDSGDEELRGGLKVVILKNVFACDKPHTPEFFEQLKSDILQECDEKLGKVTRIRIYETHPEGVIQIRFEKASSALKCIELMHGRFYAGRALSCEYWDGKVDYGRVRENEAAEEQRIAEFGKWLEHSSGSSDEEPAQA